MYCYSDTYFVLTSDIYYDGSSILSNSTAAFWQCKIDGKAQLVWISNPGTEVINCCIIKKPENVYPAIGYSQGGKAKNTKSVTKAKMKSWNSFKNIIKNAGVKK